jgi:hypothetical protein
MPLEALYEIAIQFIPPKGKWTAFAAAVDEGIHTMKLRLPKRTLLAASERS